MKAIPRVIHYCWFGHGKLSQEGKNCIASWREFFPGYEIIEWNEANFDINCCTYVKEAYEQKKWAFVSDVARFKILNECGGLYFDTDVEVIRSFEDILPLGPFLGFEKDPIPDKSVGVVAPGLGMGAYAKMPFLEQILKGHYNSHFLTNRGRQVRGETVVTRTTEYLIKQGLQAKQGVQEVAGFRIYPTEYFCPRSFESETLRVTSHTHSIHHYDASWISPQYRYQMDLTRNYLERGWNKTLAVTAARIRRMLKYRS